VWKRLERVEFNKSVILCLSGDYVDCRIPCDMTGTHLIYYGEDKSRHRNLIQLPSTPSLQSCETKMLMKTFVSLVALFTLQGEFIFAKRLSMEPTFSSS